MSAYLKYLRWDHPHPYMQFKMALTAPPTPCRDSLEMSHAGWVPDALSGSTQVLLRRKFSPEVE